MGVDVAARLALSEHLTSIGLPIIWAGQDKEPPETSGGYLEARLFRNEIDRLGVSPIHRHPGFLQVAVMNPRKFGDTAAERIAEVVQEHFPADAKFGPAKITKTPTIGEPYPDGMFLRSVVSIYFEILT